MFKSVITLDINTMTKVVSVKMVGEECTLSACCIVVPEYNAALLGTNYNAETQVFTDDNENIVLAL